MLNYIYWLGKPAIVKEKEIVKLKQILSTESNMQCNIEFFKKGTKFKMDTGPFKGQIAEIKNIFGRKISIILDGLNLRITFNLKKINWCGCKGRNLRCNYSNKTFGSFILRSILNFTIL